MGAEPQPRLLDLREEGGSVWLTLDTGESFELAPGSVPAGLPAPGGSVSSPLLVAIAAAAERKQVARRIFRMLDRRLQPVARLQTRLLETGFTAAAVEAVLEQLAAQGLYSDRTYAEAWCRDCLLGKPVGRRYLQSKLIQKQVPAAVAREAAEAVLSSAEEADLALEAARRRWARVGGQADRRAEAKVVRFLAGRGFDTGLACRAARRTRPVDARDEDGEDS